MKYLGNRNRIPRLIGLTSIFLAITSLTEASAAFDIKISVDQTKSYVRSNPNLIGLNVGWPGNGGALFADGQVEMRLFQLMTGLANGPLRYPAGEWADSYQWMDAVGSPRPNTMYHPSAVSDAKAYEKINFGTDEFRAYCRSLACTPVFQINMHQGNDDEVVARANRWLEHIATHPSDSIGPLPKVEYWELGNEPYLKGSPDSNEWASSYLYLSKEEFATRAAKVMDAMQKKHSELTKNSTSKLKFILPFALDSWRGEYCKNPDPNYSYCSDSSTVVGSQLGFGKALIDRLARSNQLSNIHALSLHYYMPLVGAIQANPPDDVTFYWATMAGTATVEKNIQKVRDFWTSNVGTSTPMPRLSITEFNSLYTTTSGLRQEGFVASQTGAMYVMDMIRLLAYQPDVDMAMLWSASQNGYFGAIDFFDVAPNYPTYVRPHYKALQMGRDLLQKDALVVPLNVEAPTYDGYTTRVGASHPYPKMPLATAAATITGKTVRVLVLNKDIGSDGRVQLTVDGKLATSVAGTVVKAGKNSQFSTSNQKLISIVENIPVATDSSANGKTSFSWLMPPTSFGLITFTLQ